MIVKCDKCQTRFKIPDGKVTPKGVKVRCTKCSNTFRVFRAPDAPAAAPQAPAAPQLPEQDPFAQFGPAPAPPARETTKPGVYAEGIEASRPDDMSSIFTEPTRVAPPPQPPSPKADDLSDIFGPPVPAAPAGFAPPAPADLSSLAGPPAPAPASASVDMDMMVDVDFGPDLSQAPPGPTEPERAVFRGPPDENEATARATPEDLFGTTDLSPADERQAEPPSLANGLFDIPPAPPETAPPALPFADGPAPPIAVPVQKPAGRPEDARGLEVAPKVRGTARRVSGVVANIVLSAVLLVVLIGVGGVYLNEGKVDLSLVSLGHVRALVFPPREVAAVDVSNGLYETREGRPVFYVRGEIANRSARPTKVKVRAEILDGSDLVRVAEGWAGTVPTAEELFAVGSAEDTEALIARLAAGAREVPPGGRAPFLLAFYEYPPDLSAYRLRVTLVDAAAETASR